MGNECSFLAMDLCLAKGTKVVTTDGLLPIEQIRVGLGVLSCRHGKKLEFNAVTRSAYLGLKYVTKITTEDGSEVFCTPEHTWMRYNGNMVKTSELCVGDRLAHVKEGDAGCPTWYIKSHHNYIKKHKAVCSFVYGECPTGMEVDHIDADHSNWKSSNLRYLSIPENRAQGGRRYWRAVKAGKRSDENRLKNLRIGLKSRRSYTGENNPNYGNKNGKYCKCPVCGKGFYIYPSQSKTYCSIQCYNISRGANHKIIDIKRGIALQEVYQLTVQPLHNYVLANGMISGNSQIELRVAAHVSQDPTMLDIFRNDGDMHMTTACHMFGLPPEKIDDKAHRRPSKTVNFGTIYLISAKGLHSQFQHEGLTQFTERDCQAFLDSWRETYPGFFDWVEEVSAEARRTGMVRDIFGRIRFTPEVNSSLKYVREAGIRQAVNAPIQSSAGGILKEAMRRIHPLVVQWREYGVVCRTLLQVHDELIWEVEDEWLPVIAPQFHDVMVNAVKLIVPLKADVETGKNWKCLEPYNAV